MPRRSSQDVRCSPCHGRPGPSCLARPRARGAILLEAILALLLVVLTVGAVAGLFSASLTRMHRAERRSEALLLAENKLAELQSGITDFTETTNGDFNGKPPKYSWAIELEPTQIPELQRMRMTITYDDPADGFTVTTYRYYSPSLNMSVEKMKEIAPDLIKRNAMLGASSSNPGFDTLLSQASEYGGEKYIDAMLRGGSPELIKLITRLQSVVMQAGQVGRMAERDRPDEPGQTDQPGSLQPPRWPGQREQANASDRPQTPEPSDASELQGQEDQPGRMDSMQPDSPMQSADRIRRNDQTQSPGVMGPGMATGNRLSGRRGAQRSGQAMQATGQTPTAETAGAANISANGTDWLDSLLSAADKEDTYPPTWSYLDTESDVAPTGTRQPTLAAANQLGRRRQNRADRTNSEQAPPANPEEDAAKPPGTAADTPVEGMTREQAIQRMRDILIQMAGKKGQR